MRRYRTARGVGAFLVLAFLALPAAPRSAGGTCDTWWQHDPAEPGDWFDPANWTNGVPGLADGACVDNGGTAAISSGTAQAHYLYSGYLATGTIAQTAGTNTALHDLFLGYEPDSQGIYELSGMGRLSAEAEYVGYYGTGRLKQTGGTNTVADDLFLNYRSGPQGTYELSGTGTLTAQDEYVGYDGSGTLRQTGGTNTVGGSLRLGGPSGGSGTYVLTGSGVLTTGTDGDVQIGCLRGQGRFEWSGGALTTPTIRLGPNGTLALGFDFAVGSLLDGTLIPGTALEGLDYAGLGVIGDATATHGSGVSAVFGRLEVDGAAATYDLSGTGTLSAWYEYIGAAGTGTFSQTDGTNTVAYDVSLGSGSGSHGTYELTGSGTLSVGGREYVGYWGTGTFKQTGGTNKVTGYLEVGYYSTSRGTYELSGTGALTADYEFVGLLGTGTFVQTGGVNTVSYSLYVAQEPQSSGTYELSGGSVTAHDLFVGAFGHGRLVLTGGHCTVGHNLFVGHNKGASGTVEIGNGAVLETEYARIGARTVGTLTQTGGTFRVEQFLYVGNWSGGDGTYDLLGGSLTAFFEEIGGGGAETGTGLMRQSGGSNAATEILLAIEAGTVGRYELSGGSLSADYELIGCGGEGTFVQTGGTNTVAQIMRLGKYGGSTGTYALSGGRLSLGELVLGMAGQGTFEFADPEAEMTVNRRAELTDNGVFSAVPGSTIHMNGAAFVNSSTSAADLAGLGNLTLIFEGGPAEMDDFEVAGEDVGSAAGGWTDNFALGTLQLGGASEGRIRLVDQFDNQPGWDGDEALYVHDLVLNAGAAISLNGLNLYYLNGGEPKQLFCGDATLDGRVDYVDLGILATYYDTSGATWARCDFSGDRVVDYVDLGVLATNYGKLTGGAPAVPAPAAAVLLAAGTLALLRRRRR